MAYIYRNPQKQNLLVAQQQRELLISERQQLTERLLWISQRIKDLDAQIAATAPLVEHDPGEFLKQAGLAQVCRIALDKSDGGWFTAQQVRQHLASLGIQLEYQNPMAVLHTTLQRVGESWRNPSTGIVYYAKKGTPIPGMPWDV